MNKYKGLIYCLECMNPKTGKCHTFKGRKERNNINYRCNYRLKYGTTKCDNDTIETIDILSIVNNIDVSKTIIEIFFTNLPIKSCYLDTKIGRLHFDSLNY